MYGYGGDPINDWNPAANVINAASNGLKTVYPKPNELQLDIDTVAQYKTFQMMRPLLNQRFTILKVVEKPSTSGKPNRKHVTITVNKPLVDSERIVLQACLGSDPKRELISFFHLLDDDPRPTLFFEKK